MENFKASGIHTKQAHVKVPEGHLEEEHGRNGFLVAFLTFITLNLQLVGLILRGLNSSSASHV